MNRTARFVNRMPAFLKAKYDRYLVGVNWPQCRKTLAAFYAFVVTVLHGLEIPVKVTLEAAIALTSAAFIVYLIIPKPKQALLDNLAEKAASDPAFADKIAAVALQLESRRQTSESKGVEPDATAHE